MNDTRCRASTPTTPVRPLTAKRRAQLAAWAKALGHPARMQIVEVLLRQDGCMCGDIVEQLDLAQSTVSQHLKMLKEAGVIRGSIDGPRVCYCVDPLVLSTFASAVQGLAELAPPPDATPC